MCVIYSNNNNKFVYIHIPKNSGRYMRGKIQSNMENNIILSLWNIENNIDLAHIPYMKIGNYIEHKYNEYFFYAHSRNPYDRLISAFYYKNSQDQCIKHFCKNILPNLNFHTEYDSQIIHYYPQYLFLCNENMTLGNIKVTKIEEEENARRYNLHEYFDQECIQIINHIYHHDFMYFNYQKI